VATSLADPPAPAAAKQPAAPPAVPPPGADGLGVQQRECTNCGAPMDSAQDWCLQCGTGAPGSLDSRAHRWRAGAAVLSAVALLIAGAAAAAYAALSKSSAKPRPALAALAQAPAASAPPPAATPPPTASATPLPATPKLGAPSIKAPIPLPKAPKVPPTTAAPKPAATTPATTTPTASKPTPAGPGTTQKQPAALVLDTNAASTYNPYGYPASNFGDPSLAIDSEKSTAWTAVVDPAVAPKMAEGLVIDLKATQKLSALTLTNSTLGMTAQVYGATGSAPPASITDPAWVPLSRLVVVGKSSQRIPLGHSKQAFRFVALWVSKAPASSVGTPTAPGRVSIDELELFPAR
jgi:hypothetical protein